MVKEELFLCKCGWEGTRADMRREYVSRCCPSCRRPIQELMPVKPEERRVPDDAATATGMYDHDDVN